MTNADQQTGSFDDGIAHIRPYFQPIVESATGCIYGAEALLRLPGVTSCEPLFRRWESTGEVAIVDATMARRVHAALEAEPLSGVITLNASALTVALAPAAYLAAASAVADVADHVVIEITETFPLLTIEALVAFAQQCKQLGIGVAFDDCSPSHEFCTQEVMARIHPEMIKLDGAFVKQCYRDATTAPLKAISDMARIHGAVVVAEHIETQEMWHWAAQLNIPLLQGYCFSPASPASKFPRAPFKLHVSQG
jgi:EAL domain-containing protein (putative c-di-GMP-specific phosphodiesterase class I)